MSTITARSSFFILRFSPWWVCAAGAVVLSLVGAVLVAREGFFGTIFALFAATFVLAGCVVASVAVPLLGRSIESIAKSPHASLAMFGALSICWVAAWIIGAFLLDLVVLLANVTVLAGVNATGSDSGGYRIEPGFWAYSAPFLIGYIVVSAVLCLAFRRRQAASEKLIQE
jgi:hypothetical protein